MLFLGSPIRDYTSQASLGACKNWQSLSDSLLKGATYSFVKKLSYVGICIRKKIFGRNDLVVAPVYRVLFFIKIDYKLLNFERFKMYLKLV